MLKILGFPQAALSYIFIVFKLLKSWLVLENPHWKTISMTNRVRLSLTIVFNHLTLRVWSFWKSSDRFLSKLRMRSHLTAVPMEQSESSQGDGDFWALKLIARAIRSHSWERDVDACARTSLVSSDFCECSTMNGESSECGMLLLNAV